MTLGLDVGPSREADVREVSALVSIDTRQRREMEEALASSITTEN